MTLTHFIARGDGVAMVLVVLTAFSFLQCLISSLSALKAL